MDSVRAAGPRLKAYIRSHWTRKMGGDVALAARAGIRRQTLQDWYAEKDVPRLSHLAAVAEALGVRRVDLVAAYDGVTAPETQETPPPEWVTGLASRRDIRALANGLGVDLDSQTELIGLAEREAAGGPPTPRLVVAKGGRGLPRKNPS